MCIYVYVYIHMCIYSYVCIYIYFQHADFYQVYIKFKFQCFTLHGNMSIYIPLSVKENLTVEKGLLSHLVYLFLCCSVLLKKV
jgi:hypothetical protein